MIPSVTLTNHNEVKNELANHNATQMRAATGAGKRTGANSNSIRLVENLALFLRPASLVSQKCSAIKKLFTC